MLVQQTDIDTKWRNQVSTLNDDINLLRNENKRLKSDLAETKNTLPNPKARDPVKPVNRSTESIDSNMSVSQMSLHVRRALDRSPSRIRSWVAAFTPRFGRKDSGNDMW